MPSEEYSLIAPVRTCEISTDLADKLNLRDGAEYSLCVGMQSARVRLAINPGLKSASLALPKDVRQALVIQRGLKTNITQSGLNIRLGPVVGVFVNPAAAERAAKGHAGFRLVELMKANQKARCILYIFSSEDVTWSPPRASGAYYDPRRNEWRRRSFPLPDVLYDRGGGFSPAQRPIAVNIRRQLCSMPGLKRLNRQHYFDKWDLYRRLMRHPPLRKHLPETVLYTSDEDLQAMLSKHGCVYIKSTLGSNGRDVMRVIAANGGYTYNYFRTDNQEGFCPDLASLIKVIQGFLGKRKSIVQAGIDLLSYNNAITDLRILAARDARGAWCIIDIPVRVARGDCAVTSTRSGSAVHRFGEFFRTALLYDEERLRELKKQIKIIVWLVIRAIEEEYGDFGELGLDIGIDKLGRIWFIEANAKPGKDTIRLAGDPQALVKAFLLPLLYCRKLAGFTDAEGAAVSVRIRALKTGTPALNIKTGTHTLSKCMRLVRHRRGLTTDGQARAAVPAVPVPLNGTNTIRYEETQAVDGAFRHNLAPMVINECWSTMKSAAVTRIVSANGTGAKISRHTVSSVFGSDSPRWAWLSARLSHGCTLSYGCHKSAGVSALKGRWFDPDIMTRLLPSRNTPDRRLRSIWMFPGS